jgi:two-component system sensor kinase FixL
MNAILSFGYAVAIFGESGLPLDLIQPRIRKGLPSMDFRRLDSSTRLTISGCLIFVIAAIDWRVDLNIAFAFLYLVPMMILGTVLSRPQTVLMAFVCTMLSDFFDPFSFTLGTTLPQDILVFSALAGSGLLAFEVTRRSLREAEDWKRVEQEVTARREAEEQLEFLIETSPAAILTMGADHKILRANSAAHRLLALEAGLLAGRSILQYVPALGRLSVSAPRQTFRTEMQCHGERGNGEVFLANVFFSTYSTAAGPRLAALIVDASEEMRDREEVSLEHLLSGSRILVGAVSHEIRNVCGAITIIHENLVRSQILQGNQDFEALGSLVETLNHIASMDLTQSSSKSRMGFVDVAETLDDLRIVLEPLCHDADIFVYWDVAKSLPAVYADRHRLLQVLLNLIKNSERALRGRELKRIDISATASKGNVVIRVTDSGPGIRSVAKLFQPFQQSAESTGLGLYISRAFVRSFRGDLRHDPSVAGCSFVIEMTTAKSGEQEHEEAGGNGPNTALIDR